MDKKRKITMEKVLKELGDEEEDSTFEWGKRLFSNGKRNSENDKEKLTNLSVLTIPEVAAKLKLINNEAAKKWLEKSGIRVHKFSKQNLVYEIEVICEIDKPFVRALKLKYPSKWRDIYRRLVKDYMVYELLILQLEGELDYFPTTRVKRNKGDEKLYKDLMG